ncbi:voltage-gated chloride channel [Saccharobesus litoralis]|uniref:Voltage-gated chloride channel n=1 Tax=Saccharobesus litoralis TaxID=2172099 RepID=A0A2S0VS18_9ALTE|nr:chloride channel protein [Saccharobesus litoralis]AWB67008.1 voltage-gated chloride channel [Saccharobesus litoralis]
MQLSKLRQQLAVPKTSIQLALLGLLGGICAALLIIAFRWSIENIQLLYLDEVDKFSSLSTWQRFALPLIGVAAILLIAKVTKFKVARTGIPFVIYRMKSFYGMMPLKNTINQFFAGIAALATGFSVGREGPSVHLGAAGTSFIGSWLKLPYNSVKTLSACGIAAGISASFNTPLAAVIFVMEVVVREYKTHVFIPVMLASVAGAILTQAVFGTGHELTDLQLDKLSAVHYPFLVFMGGVIAAFAFAFNRQLLEILRSFKPFKMAPRLILAGLITASVGAFVPEAMGNGLGAISFTQSVHDNANLLMTVFVCKAILTVFAIGLGVPGGIIGPILGLGMMLGTLLAMMGSVFIGDMHEYADIYGALGLAGLMAATLGAPLAALVAVLELTQSPDIILPAMLVIVTAHVASVQFFRNRSVFLMQLEFQKLEYQNPPAFEALQKIGILADMNRDFVLVTSKDENIIRNALDNAGDRPVVLREKSGLEASFYLVHYNVSLDPDPESPFEFELIQGVDSRYTLAEPFDILKDKRDGSIYVFEDQLDNIVGVMSWTEVRSRLIKGTIQ